MRKTLKKGSKEAKAFMAKLRAKKASAKKSVKNVATNVKRIAKNAKKAFNEGYCAKDKVGATGKTRFIFSVYKRDEFGDAIPSSKKTMIVTRVKESSALEVVYRKYPYRNYWASLSDAEYIGSTLLIEKGENPRKKPTRVVQVDRTKKGLFKKFRSVSGIGAINGVNDVKKLKQLATSSKSPLLKKVASILASKKTNGGYDTLESVFRDVSRGLQSGIISELIYYSDTTKWYKKYRKEIAKMLMDTMNEMGVDSPSDVFGKNWDTTDPFAEDTQNQNLLAWYSFEETTRNISYSLGYEL
jgi:hypothetical protein